MKTNNISNFKGALIFLFALFVIICFYPYEFYSIYLLFLPKRAFETCLVLFIPLVLIYIITKQNGKLKITHLNALAFCQWIGFTLVNINRGNVNAIISQSVLFLFVIILIHIIHQTIGLESFYKKYNRWIFVMAALGTLTWVLATFFHYSPLYALPDRAEPGRLIYNYGFTFAVLDETSSLRYSGFFDEPGAMAYWGIYALVINRLFVKEKWLEIPLMVCLLFTFSAGYYIQIILYIILFSLSKKHFGSGILMCGLFAIGIFIIESTKGSDLGFIYDMTIGRLDTMFGNTQDISLDNRSESTELAYKEFLSNPIFGTKNLNQNIGNNIFEPLALYGLVGTFFILFPFIWILVSSIKNKDYDTTRAMIVLIAGFTHRPFHNNLLYYFILYSIIVLYVSRLHNFRLGIQCQE